LKAVQADDCSGQLEWEGIPCLPFPEGGRSEGEACTPHWSEHWQLGQAGFLSAGECGGGSCLDGTCGPSAPTTLSVGEPCHLASGSVCGQWSYCASDGFCREELAPGAPCD